MKREIKFKRAHFIDEAKTKFHHVDEWGVGVKTGNHIANFVSPSSNNTALYFTDYQYTGLKENCWEVGNREIYEGDIIEFINGERLAVEWNDDTCQFQYSDGSQLNNGKRYATHKQIVGSVYENPELTVEGGDAG